MEQAIDGFLRHLKIERNSSPLTVKSYAEDVASLLAYFQDRVGYVPEARQVSVGMATSPTSTNATTRKRPSLADLRA